MADPVGVAMAFSGNTLDPTPTWTRLDSTSGLVASYNIDRGRAYELDRTDTSTAKIEINDTTGILDPTNSGGAHYGQIEPLRQAAIAIQNPVTSAWSTLFRGYVEDYDYTLDPSQRLTNLSLGLVDAFEILSAIEMQPGEFGDTPPVGSEGDIFFEEQEVDDRMAAVLASCGWNAALQVIFSGNVVLQDSMYSAGDSPLQVLQDCADAEFPGLGQFLTDRRGRLCFRGRESKFDPAGVAAGASAGAWDFTHWKCGDGAAVVASPTDTAQIRGMSFNRGLSKIINSALVTPMHIDDPPLSPPTSDVPGQLVKDGTSIGLKGIRSWSAENLLTYGAKSGANVGSGDWGGQGALDETKLFAEYYVTNYAAAANRISSLTFRSMRPGDLGATATWALLCGVEIGDLIEVTIIHPGGGGFGAEDFFVEGIHYEVAPLNSTYHDVTLTLDVSPRVYFDDGSMFGY